MRFEQCLYQITGCMIKIFMGGGLVDGEGGSSERCLKWGGWGGHKGIFLKTS